MNPMESQLDAMSRNELYALDYSIVLLHRFG